MSVFMQQVLTIIADRPFEEADINSNASVNRRHINVFRLHVHKGNTIIITPRHLIDLCNKNEVYETTNSAEDNITM